MHGTAYSTAVPAAGEPALFARGVVSLEIAERVLHAGEDVREHRRHLVDRLVVAEHLDEDAAESLAADVAERVVAVAAARRQVPRLHFRRHFGVVDAGQHVRVGTRPRKLVAGVGMAAY